MRTPLAGLVAAATACTVVVAGSAGSVGTAQAVGGLPTPTVSPLPTVTVPDPGVPGVPVPAPTLPGGGTGPRTPTLPGPTNPPGSDNDGPGQAGSDSPAPDAGTATNDSGATAAQAPGTATTSGSKAAARAAERRDRRAAAATPMVAGTAAAKDLLDDESSPQLLAASQDFLAADQGIAEIARQKRLMADLKAQATEMALLYRAIDLDVATAEGASQTLHQRHDEIQAQWVSSAREAYVTGQPTTDEGTADGIIAALARLGDAGTRADLRVGSLAVRRDEVRADFEKVAARYNETKRQLEDAKARLAALAAQRSTALQAVLAAKGSDLALHQARLLESGQLGAQIQAASAALVRTGSTVQGTGDFAVPLAGHVTSPFGMRFHPILHHTKLHTGTDIAGGSTILAADDGRVLMTVASTAYGNFTVIDHGVIDGKRATTAYAHQATFLVREGQAVRKGDQIGVVGSTGYSTGPHLHFEVREDGTVVDPMTWL